MPNSTVSAHVSRLERRLGVALLHRTTRRLDLTEAGRVFFERAVVGIEILQRAESATSLTQVMPTGLVRVTTASDILPPHLLSALVAEFQKEHPGISLEIDLTQRVVDLAHEGFDAAIRATSVTNGRLMARRIGTIRWILVSSEAYLQNAASLDGPEDLKRHALIEFYGRNRRTWCLQSTKAKHPPIELPGHTTVNHLDIIKHLLLAASGVALLPQHYVATELQRGTLCRVLPEWSAAEEAIYVAYPEQTFLAARTRIFIDFAAEFFLRHTCQ
ncbi:LysR family transcriptional regulator [Methylobacterium sp. C33D]